MNVIRPRITCLEDPRPNLIESHVILHNYRPYANNPQESQPLALSLTLSSIFVQPDSGIIIIINVQTLPHSHKKKKKKNFHYTHMPFLLVSVFINFYSQIKIEMAHEELGKVL